MRKRWAILLVTVLLTVASVVSMTAVLASGVDEKSAAVDKLAPKVAAILGLDETVVDDAIKQARKELKEEAIQAIEAKLAAMVEKGELTQEQADEKLEWFALKKKSVSKEEYLGALKAKLAALVEEGDLTQEQADEKLGWFALKKKKSVF